MRKIINKKIDFYDYITNEIIELIEEEVEFNEIEREKFYLGIITILINGLKISFIVILGLFYEPKISDKLLKNKEIKKDN